ncbi:hypothetical protein [Phenylobacterium sp.]|uniref:hypothetical protein n=1 Tax=Phenylobacterium sp. TaxID=1871053 RepID=UPI002DEAF17B|nr:hypothetical protein [Phenylobacterium sp.]
MFRRFMVALAALSLTACASPYVAKPFDRAAASVQTLGLAGDAVPEKAMAYESASVGSNFGLIGALVDAGIQSSRQNAVNNALQGASFDPEARLQARLVGQLAAEGYKVQPLPTAARPKREFLATYGSDQEVDAYLDVVLASYGYLSAGAGKPFRPTAYANVRLVSAKDPTKTLMQNRIVYNPLLAEKGVITLTPNPAYAFNNRADLLADPKRLAAGIEDALDQVADAAAQLVR